MNIYVAKSAGFCYGVKRAIKIAQNTSRVSKKPVYTYGPLIHNHQEVTRLESCGVHIANDHTPTDRLIIRSHGVGKDTRRALMKNHKLIDATCPNVTKTQKICQDFQDKGHRILIVGDENHPEIQGLLQWCGPNAQALTELSALNKPLQKEQAVAILSQTTQEEHIFQQIVSEVKENVDQVVVANTICHATSMRQEEARKLAEKTDIMIVIGGKHSANTNKLFSIIRETKTPVYHIEQANELKKSWFEGKSMAGVTAGASTPDWIIKEVVVAMEEIKNDSVEETSSDELTMADIFTPSSDETYKVGDILNAVVVQIGEDEVLVDIGAKREGVVAARELENFDELTIGDELELMLVKKSNREGSPVLSKKAIARKKYENEKKRQKRELARKFDELYQSKEENHEYQVEVTEEVKGGVVVDLEGLRGFVPASHLEIGYVNDLSKYVGKTLRARIIELDKRKNRIVLSQKDILAEERAVLREETWAKLEEDSIVKGTVCRTAKFGAFVDLGGIDGLLHISEMAWKKVGKPEDIVDIGEVIEMKILSIDRENEKIALSLKALQEDPWITALENHPEGSEVEGKVLRVTDFGAFVEIVPGFEGLLHISELAHERVEKVEDVVKPGDVINVKIIKVNPEEKKIGLSIKATLPKPVVEHRPKAKRKASPRAERKEFHYTTEEETPLTLGDVFGDLLEMKKAEEEKNKAEEESEDSLAVETEETTVEDNAEATPVEEEADETTVEDDAEATPEEDTDETVAKETTKE